MAAQTHQKPVNEDHASTRSVLIHCRPIGMLVLGSNHRILPRGTALRASRGLKALTEQPAGLRHSDLEGRGTVLEPSQ